MRGFHVNPLRCSRGQFDVTAGTQGAVSLYNNDSTKSLRVLDWACLGAGTAAAYVTKTRLTTQNVGLVNPVVTDEPRHPGLLDTQDLGGSFTTFDFVAQNVNTVGTQGPAWAGHCYPFAVLRPGWSLVVAPEAPGGLPNVSFFWDWLWPDELLNFKIGDPEIDD